MSRRESARARRTRESQADELYRKILLVCREYPPLVAVTVICDLFVQLTARHVATVEAIDELLTRVRHAATELWLRQEPTEGKPL